MFDRVKSFAKRMGNKLKYGAAIVSAAVGTAIMSVVASAEGNETTVTDSMSSAVNSAKDTLISGFQSLVTTLVPVVVTIAVAGLGMYAVIMLFQLAKKMFKTAAK